MAETTLVSVIIPVHRPGEHFESALRSVINQELPSGVSLEVVVVFDGPDTDAEALLARVVPQAVVETHPENRGPSAARNTGLKTARGDWFAFLDADDLWVPNRILRDLEILGDNSSRAKPVAVMSFHQAIRKNSEGQWEQQIPAWMFLTGIGTYHRSIFDLVGGFDESMRYGEDSDWFFRLWEAGCPFRIRYEVGLLYRIHKDSMTWSKSIPEKGHLKALKKSLDRRRSGSGRARELLSPAPSLRLSDRCGSPQRTISILRSCMQEKWRYYTEPFPVRVITWDSRISDASRHCRETVLIDPNDPTAIKRAIQDCDEPFIALEPPRWRSHPRRYHELLAAFDLFPQDDVVLFSYLVENDNDWQEKGNPEVACFLARKSFMYEFADEYSLFTKPEKAMFRAFCGWKKRGANLRILPWPLTAKLAAAPDV